MMMNMSFSPLNGCWCLPGRGVQRNPYERRCLWCGRVSQETNLEGWSNARSDLQGILFASLFFWLGCCYTCRVRVAHFFACDLIQLPGVFFMCWRLVLGIY